MTTAREIMTPNARCVRSSDNIADAARTMAELNVGALPICGEDGRLKGMLTDRDIVVKAVAHGLDPESTPSRTLAAGKPVTVDAADDIGIALDRMREHQIRRLPVIEDHQLVGIISQADIALALSPETTGATVEEISRQGVS